MSINTVRSVAGRITCTVRVLRAEIQLQTRALELEGRAAADRGGHRSRGIAVRAVVFVSIIIAVAIFSILAIPQLRQSLVDRSLVSLSSPSALVSCEALFVVDRRGRNDVNNMVNTFGFTLAVDF